jgi:hypothetical protein
MTASNSLLLDCDPEVEFAPAITSDVYWATNQKFVSNTTSVVYVSFTSTSFSEEAKQIISRLTSFRTLEENWDSYGAVAPNQQIIENAIRFVKKADKNLLPFFFAAPGPNGELVIEFKKGNREAAAYFNPEGTTELILSENNQTQLEGSLEDNYKDLLSFMNT